MRVIIAANRAPVRKTDDGWAPSVGGLATALLPVLKQQGGVWVASKERGADTPDRQFFPEDDPTLLLRRVALSDDEINKFYYGMANRVLWPVSHYMTHHLELNPGYMDVYREVNRRFADAVVDEYCDGDLIWIQDYHLMLAPQYIREARPDATISHFWHIPWPAMEVFRILPWSRELLAGMLGSDLIGFHVHEYVDNFLESARVLLGAATGDGTVEWEGRTVRVEAHPIGIDTEAFDNMRSDCDTAAAQLRRDLGVEQIIVGVDRLDYTKGILSRLEAFETFLHQNPRYHRRIGFVQIATPSRTQVASYRSLKRDVDEIVGRINGQFAQDDWVPVHYRYRTYTQEELCAFYRAADVAFITPWRDGMNLVTQEYIAANAKGVLVLSELTGAAYLMPEALQVNPFDQRGMVATLKEALEMPRDEREQRMQRLRRTVRSLDVHVWARTFLDSLVPSEESDV